jgi:uncharacterized protein YutE (UPF0331/DUF86 family)
VVDQERVDRLLALVSDDVRQLAEYHPRGVGDRTELAAAKYYFITAIEGCARTAQHLIAAEDWPVAESNAEAIRRLAERGVIDKSTASAVASAVGFSNVLVHGYAEVDDRVTANLEQLDDLTGFVRGVAAWLSEQVGKETSR